MKEYLFTPGPTTIPDRIFKAMSKPTMHHRSKEFEGEFREALQNLKELFECDETPIMLSASGTGAMEASLLNTLNPGDKLIVLNAGVFGERWVLIGKRLGLEVVEVKAPLGKSPALSDIETTLQQHKDARAFALQATETSTTVNHPFADITAAVKKHIPNCLTVLDAVSAAATIDISLKRHNLDIIVAGSQKGFMLPPGLAMLMLNRRAWDEVDTHQARSFYFDLKVERSAHEKGTSAWTPAMNHILGLNESFRMLREEKFVNVYARHEKLARGMRAGLKALGFKLLAPDHPSTGVTGAYPPDGVDAESLRSELLKRYSIKVTGGQAALQGKVIRVGHMGCVNTPDLIVCLNAIEEICASNSKGAGASAAAEEFAR